MLPPSKSCSIVLVPDQRLSPNWTGKGEGRLIAIACSQPPEGRERWSLQLLADRLVQLEVVDSISTNTVQPRLKRTNCGRM